MLKIPEPRADQRSRNDMDAFWMPFTANRAFKADPLMIAGAKGNHYILENGRRVLDVSAALWCVNAGHGRTEIVEAIQAQAATLDFVANFNNGATPAFELATRLSLLAPGDLNRVFFTNSGSESVDSAMKIAMAFHAARGEGQRQRFVGRQMAYHGVGFGGLSVAGLGPNRKTFGTLLPGVAHLPHTLDHGRNAFSKGQPEYGVELADALEGIVAMNDASTIAAVIVEPVGGAGGVLPPPKGYLERLRQICDKHGLLLIFDEVITGFGRLGTTFAAEYFNVLPDMITCAKGLTNAAVPMGAVIVRDGIFDAIVEGSVGPGPEFSHGYTYSGHPLAAAAGIATLNVHRDEDLNGKARVLGAEIEAQFHTLADHPKVKDIRNLGVLAAVQFHSREGAPGARSRELRLRCLEGGALLRAGVDNVLISPPLTFTAEDVNLVVTQIRKALDAIE
ncbi:MAG: aminotransferase class III-fold pyridoxal phosphate-dependent enzyme [Rhizobiaceae bacterium]|nr:aminotransferase class III-fold pyridoxal phosphate-dependent enzyme [Rhizobiaceae bacterium]